MRDGAIDGRPTGDTARPRRRRAVLAAAAALLVSLFGGSVVAVSAQAAGAKHLRIGLVAASDGFLVFRQKVATPYSISFPTGSSFFFVGTDGKRHALPDVDPALFVDVAGSTLTQSAGSTLAADPAAAQQVRWRDLRTGASGVGELPAGDDYAGAAPKGWIATRTAGADPKHVIRYRATGATSDLGAPFAAGVPWDLRSGKSGVLAVSADAIEDYSEEGAVGVIRYQPYDAPGEWRTVYAPGPGAKMFCNAPSSTHVVCEAYSSASTHSGQVLIALRDGKRRWQDAHPKSCPTTSLAVVGSSAFGRVTGGDERCVAGRIERLSAAGVLTVSKRTHGGRGNSFGGLGGFLFTSADQRTVLRLTKAGGTPKVVVRAR